MAKNNQELNTVIGLKVDIVDDNTGAPAGYHVISGLNIFVNSGYCDVTLSSYYNQNLQQAGKHAMGTVGITVHGIPPRGVDVFDWAYRSIVAPVAPDAVDAYGSPLQAHVFTGAELVAETPAKANAEAG